MTTTPDPFLLKHLRDAGKDSPLRELQHITDAGFIERFTHGDLHRWLETIKNLPDLEPESVDLKTQIRIGAKPGSVGTADKLEKMLRQFIPWRKGPFELFGVQVESEWQSDMKWNRVLPHMLPLGGRKVLDVGCGNGYHCWRALGEGARLVIGVEPYLLYVMQFLTVKNYLRQSPCFVLPLSLEDYPGPFAYYDTVFSMGVIYHVRSPIDHLLQLKKVLVPGGQLILETLIVDGELGYSLTPAGRYARMGNVWFIPSPATLERWLQRAGFCEIKMVDSSVTTPDEQHSTSWMPFQSLIDGLDPNDSGNTCEGLPAPKRVIMTAINPD